MDEWGVFQAAALSSGDKESLKKPYQCCISRKCRFLVHIMIIDYRFLCALES